MSKSKQHITIDTMNKTELKQYLQQEELKTLHSLKIHLDDLYYNTSESTIPDWKYDMLKDILQQRDPDWVPPVGTKMRQHSNRTSLPYWLGSIDKVTSEEEKELMRWVNKNPAKNYICTDKLDGVSCLVEYKDGQVKLYTRGDGEIGSDISYITNYSQDLVPTFDGNDKQVYIRGELIMAKNTFQQKYSKKYKNARNMVSGLIGSKTLRQGMNDIDFIAYEIVDIDHSFPLEIARGCTNVNPEQQIITLNEIGFKTPEMAVFNSLSTSHLTTYLEERKRRCEYDLDGLVIQSNTAYKRNTSGNPSYAIAFKVNTKENILTTTVKDIEWNISRWGCIKPVVVVNPVELQGVTISRATAHNAKYIVDNNLGKGAIVRITRSNEVIPYIVEVVESKKADLPDIEYRWDETKVNIYVKQRNQVMEVKMINNFFSKMRIKHISEMTIHKLFDHGFNNLIKILKAKVSDLETIPRLGRRSAERIVNNIHTGLQNVDRSAVLGASGIFGFGFGRKRVDLLLKAMPNIFEEYKNMTKTDLKKRVLSIDGFSRVMTNKVVDGISTANKFLTSIGKFATFTEEKKNDNTTLSDKKFIFTGFRDKALETKITSLGGTVSSSVSGKTAAVVVKDENYKPSSKTKKALTLNIPILTLDAFKTEYNLN